MESLNFAECPYTLMSATCGDKIKYFLSCDNPQAGDFLINIGQFGLVRNSDGSLDQRYSAFKRLLQKQFNVTPEKQRANLFKQFCF